MPSPLRSELTGVVLIAFGGALALAGALRSRHWSRRIDPSYPPPSQRTLTMLGAAAVTLELRLAIYVLT